MEGAELTLWLRELQREFVVRMTALDEQAGKAEAGVEEEDDEANDEAADGEVEATATRHSVSPDVRQGSETAMDVERLRKRHARQESSAEN
ncbi:hypothetical protein LTS02_018465, partial [Friedmanniomyces endolithicus]